MKSLLGIERKQWNRDDDNCSVLGLFACLFGLERKLLSGKMTIRYQVA